MSTKSPLAGQAAVVTGASSGIGRAIAIRLAQQGADVLVHAGRRQLEAESTAAEVAEYGVRSETAIVDLSESSGVDELIEKAWRWDEQIRIWVNNAGVDVLTGAAAAAEFADKLDLLYQVDVRAGMELARKAGQRMRNLSLPSGACSLTTIGWDQAEFGMAGDSGEMFAAVKGAVMAFTRSLAKSLAPQVRVNCVAPGWIKTAWGDEAPEYWQQRARSESLLERWGEPQDVAAAVAFLVSPAAGFINAQTIQVNGGFRHSLTAPSSSGSDDEGPST